MKFKKGDIITGIRNYYTVTRENILVKVLKVDGDYLAVKLLNPDQFDKLMELDVDFDESDRKRCLENFDVESRYFKHVRIKDTKLARKMYPKHHIDGKWLYKE